MAGRLEGKVAFITGVARGQGRSHAVRLAEEGADIIAVDICEPLEFIEYEGATETDLKETVALVEARGRRILATKADVRDLAALDAALAEGVAALGRLDIVCANAAIGDFIPVEAMSDARWTQMIDVNLNGVWRTCKAAIPHLIKGARGGSIVLISSTAGLRGAANLAHYSAAKHGVVGLMRSLAQELGRHSIRVNTVHPTAVDTAMVHNDGVYRLFVPDAENPTRQQVAEVSVRNHLLPIPWVDPVDISNAIVFLASDEARYITGITLPVDAGNTQK